MNESEPMLSVASAVAFLSLPAPLDRGTLAQLGKDCSLAARVMNRPTGKVTVVGMPWPTEKTYTFDVLREAFRLHPATKNYVPNNH